MTAELFLSILLANGVLCAAPTHIASGTKAPTWSLQDVNDVPYDSNTFVGRKLLIIGGDKSSQQDNELWGERAMKECGHDLAAIGIADVSSAPRLWRSRVKAQFRRQESSRPSGRIGVPLLLDWEGVMARSFHFIPKVSNVFLVGPEGVIRFS